MVILTKASQQRRQNIVEIQKSWIVFSLRKKGTIQVFFQTKRKSEALFMNHVTSYSTSEGDVTWVGFKSMFIYGPRGAKASLFLL